MDGRTEVSTQSTIDTEISLLENSITETRKAIENLAERLVPILSCPTPTTKSEKETRSSICPLQDKMTAMLIVVEGNILILTDVAERLQI